MSKIYDAYRKNSGSNEEIIGDLTPVRAADVFPPLQGKQQEEFTQLANRLLNIRNPERSTVISFASSVSGEGASFVSYHAAAQLANTYGMRVAWFDCNFLSPHRALECGSGATVADLFLEPGQVHFLHPANDFMVVPAGTNLIGQRGLFVSAEFDNLLKTIHDLFDFVIVDLPPLLKASDSALIAQRTDGFLLVIEQRFLKWEILESAIQDLKDKGVNVLGSVINKRQFELPKVIYDRL